MNHRQARKTGWTIIVCGCFFIILFYDFFRLTLRNCFFVYGIEFSLFFCHEFLPPFYVFFLNILSN